MTSRKVIKSAFESMLFVWGQMLPAKDAAEVFDISESDAIGIFRELVPEQGNRYSVSVSFASMLQMMREHYLDADQKVTFGDIRVFRGKRPFEDAGEGGNG
ncbi:MAG: hypothetical protein IIZ34_03700 [Eubacterium sp.]|nr:hypothetical protein [Eubacterium sp.]